MNQNMFEGIAKLVVAIGSTVLGCIGIKKAIDHIKDSQTPKP